MQKKSLLVALFFGALCLTGCLKNEESASVAQVRLAKAEELKASAALKNAQAQAEVIYANAEATLKQAEAALLNAKAETEKVRAELLKVQVKLAEVKVEEEKVELQKRQAELEVILAQAEAGKQAWINVLNNLLAQAEIDALQNELDALDAIAAFENSTAEGAAMYARKYYAALAQVQRLQLQEIQAKAMKILVETGAKAASKVIDYQIDQIDDEIAEKEAIIAALKARQTMTPEEAKAALIEARVALGDAYADYKDALEALEKAQDKDNELWNKSADFTFGWPNSFVNDLKTILPDYTKYRFDTGYGWVELSGYYDEEGEFVPLYNREQYLYNGERYPDVQVYNYGDFTVLDHTGIIPATIFYDNIEEKLTEVKADFAEEQEKQAKLDKKNAIENNYTVKHVDEYIAEYEERVKLAKAYIAGHKTMIETAEKKFKENVAAYDKAKETYESTWKDFADYIIANYNVSRDLFTDRYEKEQTYLADKVKSDKALETLNAEKAKLPGLEQDYKDAVADEPKKEGAYHLAEAEVEGLPEAKADRDTKKGTYETKKAAVAPLKTAMDNAKNDFDKAAEMIVRYPKGTPEYESTYKAQYNTAKTAYDKAVEAYNDAVEAEAKAKTAYDKAEAKVKELSGPVDAALKAWNAAKELIVTTKKAWDDKKAEVAEPNGKTYKAWKDADDATKIAKQNWEQAEKTLKEQAGVASDAKADALYKAYLTAKEAWAKATGADYNALYNLYWTANPDDFAEGTEYGAHTYPRLSWMRANYDVNTNTTYIARVWENGKYVYTEKPIVEAVYGFIAPFTYEWVIEQEWYSWVDGETGEEMWDWYWGINPQYTYDYEAEPVADLTNSAQHYVDYYKALKASVENFEDTIDAYYDSVVEANDIVVDKVIANAKAYKAYEASYQDWIQERYDSEEVVNEAQKVAFDAEQVYREVKADYEALEAVADGKFYVYVGEGVPGADEEGFVELSINEAIEELEGNVGMLYNAVAQLVGVINGDFDVEDLQEYDTDNKSIFELTLVKKVLVKAKEYGKVTVEIVLEMLDDQIKYIDEQIDIWTVIANKYKVAMYAYLGIDETGPLADEEE